MASDSDRWIDVVRCRSPAGVSHRRLPYLILVERVSATPSHLVGLSTKEKPRLTGLIEADEGARTLDLLHGKRVVGSPHPLRKEA
jgi:hypothetical protein